MNDSSSDGERARAHGTWTIGKVPIMHARSQGMGGGCQRTVAGKIPQIKAG